MNAENIISFRNVTVSFDGYKAIDGVDIDFPTGGVQFVIGPNGAGKTTLLDVICGRVSPAKGKVIYKNNQEIQSFSPEKIVHLGISRKFQNPSVFPAQSVQQNMELAVSSGKRTLWYFFKAKLQSAAYQRVDEVLEFIRLGPYRHRTAGSLSHGQKQWLEIGMAIVNDPDLLLVDEPVAGMTESERNRTGELLQEIGRSRTVIVVEHDMNFVRKYAHDVTVMHEGKVLCRGDFETVTGNSKVIEIYLGKYEHSALD